MDKRMVVPQSLASSVAAVAVNTSGEVPCECRPSTSYVSMTPATSAMPATRPVSKKRVIPQAAVSLPHSVH